MHDACADHMHSSTDEAILCVFFQRKASALSANFNMESNSNSTSNTKYTFDEKSEKSEALFREADELLDAEEPSIQKNSEQPPPDTGKTPTTDDNHEAVLATAVDGGSGSLCIDSMPSQGIHIISPKVDTGDD